MDRKDAHETRIDEVRKALASVQKMQAELARRNPSTELAVCDDNSRDLTVDAHDGGRPLSSLGVGVVVLLVLVGGAAALAAFGPRFAPETLPPWIKPHIASAWRLMGVDPLPSPGKVADHLPRLAMGERDEPTLAIEAAGDDTARIAPEKHQARERVPSFEERLRPPQKAPSRVASLPAPREDLASIEAERAAPRADAAGDVSPPRQPAEPSAAQDNAKPAPRRVTQPAVIPPPLPPAAARDVALREARKLFEDNQIAAARAKLMAFAPEDNADIAWALARTFDPRHIRSVGGTPEEGDVGQAEKWYRRWYEVGVEQGLVSKRFRIERLIAAMRQP